MTAMIIYIAHPLTGEYLGSSEADPSPLEPEVWLIPANATELSPPQPGAREVAVWRNEAWSLLPDWRGVDLFAMADGAAVQLNEIGISPADISATDQPRPSAAHVWHSGQWIKDPALEATLLTKLKDELCRAVDAAADAARSAVAGDPLRAVEYDRAATEAQAFKAAGYPGDAVPRTVAAWAIGGRTAQQAADSILVESAAYTEALYQIREARLGAKEMVRQAMAVDDVDRAQDIAAETIAAIESAISGIGNARG